MNARFPLALAALLALGTACDPSSKGDDSAPDDSGVDDSAADDTGVVASGALTELVDPCQGAGTPYAIHFSSESQGWVGCGNGYGLHGSSDGGDSFSSAHPSADLYVWQIIEDPSGRLLVCGHDYEGSDGLLFRDDGAGGWDVLLRYGNNASSDDSVYITDCGQVGALDDGTLIVANSTGPDITWSSNDGLSWAEADRYWEDVNIDGGPQAYQMISMATTSDSYAAGGYNIIQPPTFFGPSTHPDGQFYNMHAYTIDEGVDGEVWSLATPDDGATWYAGGRDQSNSAAASGFIYSSTDGGESWTAASLGDSIDIVHDIKFAEDGQHGVAVGHRYPPATLGGFVLVTEDAGASWSEVETDVPILFSAAARGGSYWVGGDGYLGRGSF